MLPTDVIVAIIRSGGDLLGKVIDKMGATESSTGLRAEKVISDNYDKIKTFVTDNSAQVLIYLADGRNRPPFEIINYVFPDLEVPNEARPRFEREFEYRLEYLRAFGLLTRVTGSEWSLSQLGDTFVNRARRDTTYSHLFAMR